MRWADRQPGPARYFGALQAAGIADTYHYNLRLRAAPSRQSVQTLLTAAARAGENTILM